jgi:hypothetical protein
MNLRIFFGAALQDGGLCWPDERSAQTATLYIAVRDRYGSGWGIEREASEEYPMVSSARRGSWSIHNESISYSIWFNAGGRGCLICRRRACVVPFYSEAQSRTFSPI